MEVSYSKIKVVKIEATGKRTRLKMMWRELSFPLHLLSMPFEFHLHLVPLKRVTLSNSTEFKSKVQRYLWICRRFFFVQSGLT
jgi:hypothetical protein